MKIQDSQEQMRAVGGWKDFFFFYCLPSKTWEAHGGMIITPKIALRSLECCRDNRNGWELRLCFTAFEGGYLWIKSSAPRGHVKTERGGLRCSQWYLEERVSQNW